MGSLNSYRIPGWDIIPLASDDTQIASCVCANSGTRIQCGLGLISDVWERLWDVNKQANVKNKYECTVDDS